MTATSHSEPILQPIGSFVIIGKPPSMDALDGHRWAKTTWKRKYLKAIVPPVGVQRAVVRSGRARRLVSVARYCGKRQRPYDEGNFIGGCRPLMDALVTHGWLVDDTPEWLTASYTQFAPGWLPLALVRVEAVAAFERRVLASGGMEVNVYGYFKGDTEVRIGEVNGGDTRAGRKGLRVDGPT